MAETLTMTDKYMQLNAPSTLVSACYNIWKYQQMFAAHANITAPNTGRRWPLNICTEVTECES